MNPMIGVNGLTKERVKNRKGGKTVNHWIVDLPFFFFRRKILRKRIPLLASFKLTYRCNLRCGGCPFHTRTGEHNAHMTWDTAIESLHALHKAGCRIIIFEGGEPFLWNDGTHDLKELVEYARRLFFRVGVTTNGTFPLNIPAHVIWVSLDGLKETHDRLRCNSFDRVWNNVKETNHPKILVHTTINRENRHELDRLAEKIASLPAVKGMTVQLFYPYGQGEKFLGLTPGERKEALEKVIHLKRRGYPIFNSEYCLRSMIDNSWICHDDMLINIDPDGRITEGCYVKNRGVIQCRECGFTPVAEASGCLDLLPGSILAGWNIFIRGTAPPAGYEKNISKHR